MKYVRENFIAEVNSLEDTKNILIIPLGRAVEEVLLKLSEEGIIQKNQILFGFPHPSGANVNMKNQFNDNKDYMITKIKNYHLDT